LHFFALYQEIHPPQEVNPDFFNEINSLVMFSEKFFGWFSFEN